MAKSKSSASIEWGRLLPDKKTMGWITLCMLPIVACGLLWKNSDHVSHLMDGDDPRIDDDLEYKLHEVYGSDTDDKMINALEEYIDTYGCGVDEVKIGTIDSPEYSSTGFRYLEQAISGNMNFDLEALDVSEDAKELLIGTVTHAATHVCTTSEKYMLENTVFGRNETEKIIAYQGLGILLERTNQKSDITQMTPEEYEQYKHDQELIKMYGGLPFLYIEEGVAEWLASRMDNGYILNPIYSPVYNLTDNLISAEYDSNPQLIADLIKKPDGLLSFLEIAKSSGNFSGTLQDLMHLYDNAYKSQGQNTQILDPNSSPIVPTPINQYDSQPNSAPIDPLSPANQLQGGGVNNNNGWPSGLIPTPMFKP